MITNTVTGERAMQSFRDWQLWLRESENHNRVAVLVTAFKTLHPDAPPEDLTNTGGRLAGMVKQCGDAGLVLLRIWTTSPATIAGSHLNYINASLQPKTGQPGQLRQPYGAQGNSAEHRHNHYTSGKYGHLVHQ